MYGCWLGPISVLFFILKQFHIKRLTVISKMPVNDHRLLRLLGMFASKVVKLKNFGNQ